MVNNKQVFLQVEILPITCQEKKKYCDTLKANFFGKLKQALLEDTNVSHKKVEDIEEGERIDVTFKWYGKSHTFKYTVVSISEELYDEGSFIEQLENLFTE